MLIQCWAPVADGGPTLNQHWTCPARRDTPSLPHGRDLSTRRVLSRIICTSAAPVCLPSRPKQFSGNILVCDGYTSHWLASTGQNKPSVSLPAWAAVSCLTLCPRKDEALAQCWLNVGPPIIISSPARDSALVYGWA